MEKICTRTWSSFDRQIKSSLRRHHTLCTRAKKAIKKRKKNRDKRKRHHVVAGENRRCRRRSVPSSKKKKRRREDETFRPRVVVERKTKKRQKRLAKTPGRSREKRYDVFPRILLSFSSTRATTERRNKDDCHEQQKQQRSINEHISFLIQIRHE